jgi:UPF0755 protein
MGLILILLIALTLYIRHIYYQNLSPPSTSQTSQIVTVPNGASVDQIADLLHKDNLIQSPWSFEWYVRAAGLGDSLEAGTYALNPAQDVQGVVGTLTSGKVATKLVTILPGKRLDQISATLINNGFNPAAVAAAMEPAQYAGLPALAIKPPGVSLEGLLYPDSFEKTAATDPSVIIRESLVEMGEKLTPPLQTTFAHEGLSTYQGLVLASIVQQEVSSPSDQAQVAQVFLKRLSLGMPLGSDVTALYGAIEANQPPSLSYASPYNTLLHTGLPPTPISTVSQASLNAVANPAPTDWLYFVAGDNGTTYFSQTLQQQQANVAAYCHNLCSQQ